MKIEEIIRSYMDEDYRCGNCSRRKWYQKGFDDGIKSEQNRWIPVSERMPEEHDTMISKDAKRLGVWNGWIHKKCSDEVEITIEMFEGKRIVSVSKTCDGKWIHPIVSYLCGKVVAWRELPEPYQGE